LVARTGDMILIDNRNACRVMLNPEPGEVKKYRAGLKRIESSEPLSDTTADGFRVKIGVNVARTEELALLKKLDVRRIGLFRSEFVFMESMDLPSEKFQCDVYTRVVKAAPEMAVLRSIDIGSDKPLRYVPLAREENPAMGFRSVRFSLSRADILVPQLRAMIKAAQHGNCRIIFPMVAVASELAAIAEVYQRVIDEVKPAKVPEWGIMLEVPSAAFMLEEISRYTKYISLGTNDLLQFFYAIDRTNEKLAGLADYLCPAFLRFLNVCVKDAQRLGIKIGICGEMASDPAGFLALLGIGVEEFSMRPAAVEKIKAMLPKIKRGKIMATLEPLLVTGNAAQAIQSFLSGL
ncbi:MAG: hypothetical protein PHD82_12760, partial [Candidatus Riflebacteria bacterium]|nr:hypothetical protein [Candidatus Riflebacteria bacterium]